MSLPVPPLRGQQPDDVFLPLKQPEDGLRDTVAAVEAQLADDRDGLAAILASCDHTAVAAVALKLLAEAIVTAERGFPPCRCHFREWALLAVHRG